MVNGDHGTAAIRNDLKYLLSLDLRCLLHPYGKGWTESRIARKLAQINLVQVPAHKKSTYLRTPYQVQMWSRSFWIRDHPSRQNGIY